MGGVALNVPQFMRSITKEIEGKSESILFTGRREGETDSRKTPSISITHLLPIQTIPKGRKIRKNTNIIFYIFNFQYILKPLTLLCFPSKDSCNKSLCFLPEKNWTDKNPEDGDFNESDLMRPRVWSSSVYFASRPTSSWRSSPMKRKADANCPTEEEKSCAFVFRNSRQQETQGRNITIWYLRPSATIHRILRNNAKTSVGNAIFLSSWRASSVQFPYSVSLLALPPWQLNSGSISYFLSHSLPPRSSS